MKKRRGDGPGRRQDAGDWPSFETHVLETASAAFRRRRKSLSHRYLFFKLTRELEDGAAGPMERLNVDIDTCSPVGEPTSVRLSVWPDGVLWLRACQAAKRGWKFLLAFHGRLGSPRAVHGLLARFEESLLLVGSTRKADCEEQILSLWRDVHPVVERSRRG